jgi:hypothetical protein
MRPLKREKHTALEAWKPAKNAGSHIPTAAAATASKGTKNQIPRQMRSFPLSCVEPFVLHSMSCGLVRFVRTCRLKVNGMAQQSFQNKCERVGRF